MSFLQHMLILILINSINISTTSIQSTTIEPIYEKTIAAIVKIRNDLKRDEEQLKIDRELFEQNEKQLKKSIKKTDVIRLNVGGEMIMTTRETLTRIPKSILSIMFNGRWEYKLPFDQNENIFFDFNPIIFRHLLHQLQLFDTNNSNYISPPSQPSLVTPFNKMLRKLDLHHLLSSEKNINNIDVIRLNVGGEMMMTTRETLTRIPKSILSLIFNGRWEHKLPVDQNGNIFFDFNPIIFRHLLDQLQLLHTNNLNYISPPSQPSLVTQFKKMLRKLDLHHLLSSEKDIITFNVDGQFITNQRKTFTQISNSTFDTIVSPSKTMNFDDKSDVFVDYNPKFFRHLINQLREESLKNKSYLTAPSYKEKLTFQKMLNDLSIYRQLLSSPPRINIQMKWKQNGVTVAGGNGVGNQLNQLYKPHGITVDDDEQCIYIVDHFFDRIVKWKFGAKNGQVVAGGNGKGNRKDQLNLPTDVIVDKKTNSLIICDQMNRRVVRWSRENGANGQTIISDIQCIGLTMDNNGDLYVSDRGRNEVRRWKIGDTSGTIVAGGNEQGNQLNQLNDPVYLFVDQDHSVYVSDSGNHRVMKWMKGAKEGIVVAGGQGKGNSLTQLHNPQGVIVDHFGNVFVADCNNDRIMRWSPGSKEGSIIVGGNGQGQQSNQFYYVIGLSFDQQGNLYVVDYVNNRVQKFDIDSNCCFDKMNFDG